MNDKTALILAAGKGTRMKSDLPKVLHKINGLSLVGHVIEAVRAAGVDNIFVVVGHGSELVEQEIKKYGCKIIEQKEQLGTGHAVMTAAGYLPDRGELLLVCGDSPLIRAATLDNLMDMHRRNNAKITLLTANVNNPFGYGRIVRDSSGKITKILEEKDASPEEKKISEVNSGTYCFDLENLKATITSINSNNAQNEYYLTDVIPLTINRHGDIASWKLEDPEEMSGINDRIQMAAAGNVLRKRKLEELMLSGVTIVDPALTFIDKDVNIGKDSIIYPNVYLEKASRIGDNCIIRGNTRIHGCSIGNGCTVESSVLLDATIGDGCNIGPFAYIRPGSILSDNVKIGDFVEVKNSRVGAGSKIPHLSYVGDAVIGEKVNIGAGTITCNYDGTHKYKTEIGNGAFIGSNTSLVAPVKVDEGGYVGAGSVITKNVPAGALAVTRAQQKNIENFLARKSTKKNEEEKGKQ